MNKKWEDVLKVVEEDAEIRHSYFDKEGRGCIIGGLAIAAGVPLAQMDRSWVEGCSDSPYAAVNYRIRYFREDSPLLIKIRERFGLDVKDLQSLQDVNDSTADVVYRRVSLREKVAELRELDRRAGGFDIYGIPTVSRPT